jgi:polyisoprenoid-binding protein YceI
MHAEGTAIHPSRTPTPGHYRLDPDRTTIRFRTRHMFGLGVVRGEFALRGGHVDVADSISDTGVTAVVVAESFDTGHPTRDRMVRSATYLDVKRFPDLRFVSDTVEAGADCWIVVGTLYAHGVAAPLRITVSAVEITTGEITLRASAPVDRFAHGIKSGRGVAARRLSVDIIAVAVANDAVLPQVD